MGPKARHPGTRKNWERAVGISAEGWISRLNAAYALQQTVPSKASR